MRGRTKKKEEEEEKKEEKKNNQLFLCEAPNRIIFPIFIGTKSDFDESLIRRAKKGKEKCKNECFRYSSVCVGGIGCGWGLDAPAHPSATIL